MALVESRGWHTVVVILLTAKNGHVESRGAGRISVWPHDRPAALLFPLPYPVIYLPISVNR